jgi:class 3 adenylate cyclase
VTNTDQRLQHVIAAFVRQEFGAPVAAIVGLAEILIEDARRSGDETHVSDFERIRSAGLSLQEQLGSLINLAKQAPVGNQDPAKFKSRLRHDLRTPLNAVKGYSELIIEDARDCGRVEIVEDVRKILTSVEELLAKIDRVVDLTDGSESADAQSTPMGATFFPRQVGDLMRSIQPVAPKSREQSASGRILVVDDNEANRDLLSRRLSRNGHMVDTADSGKSALQAVTKATYDLILLDLMMPEMNGLEVLTRLKADPAVQHVPVMMISALDEINSIVTCIEAGAEDYIPKPFDPVLLNARIDASLERKRLRDREQAFLDQLKVEKSKSESLLFNILPETIIRRIRQGEVEIADRFTEATILFSDLVGFTGLANRCPPSRIVEILNDLFSAFDALAERLRLEKIKTIGDAYMVAGGLPEQNPEHAIAVAHMALGMIEIVHETGKRFGERLEVRIGIHSGEVVAGLIGRHRSIYDVWGDTVNTASRLESSGAPNRIQISDATYNKLKDAFFCELRGPVEIKGKGNDADLLSGPETAVSLGSIGKSGEPSAHGRSGRGSSPTPIPRLDCLHPRPERLNRPHRRAWPLLTRSSARSLEAKCG